MELEDGDEIAERSTVILVRFPTLDFFANVHLGERIEPKDRSLPPLAGDGTASTKASRKRPRGPATVDAHRYVFDPDATMKFVGNSLTSASPRLRVATSVEKRDDDDDDRGVTWAEFTGTWQAAGRVVEGKANTVVVHLKPDGSPAGGGAEEVKRPASLLTHPEEGRTRDEVLVTQKIRGVQRKGMLEVSQAGLVKGPKWQYAEVLVPEAVLEMRRVL